VKIRVCSWLKFAFCYLECPAIENGTPRGFVMTEIFPTFGGSNDSTLPPGF
jgi:hypothetical protein